MSRASDPATGIRFVLIAVMLFALQDGISKHLAQSYPVPFFVMIRYWFFAAFVIVVASRSEGGIRAAWRTKMPLVQIFRGVLLVFQIWVIVTSFDLIGLGPTHAIFALHPLLATLLAIPILGEMVGWRRMVAVGVGFLGILVILRPGAGVFDPYALIAVGSAFLFAFYSVLTRLVARADGSARPAFFYTGIAGAVAATLVGPFFWTEMLATDWAWLGALCVTGMSGHYCLIRALDATEAVRIQPFIYLQMVFTMALGWVVFGEPFDPVTLLGGAMIIGAGLYAIWREWAAIERAKAAARTAEKSLKG
ncbi:DMT family transporter [Thermohalobaculum xanthum]|nr:DMT family transporter [Thermohalobaculum xanthum]